MITVCNLHPILPQLHSLMQNAGDKLSGEESDIDEFEPPPLDPDEPEQPPLSPDCSQRRTHEPITRAPTIPNGDIPSASNIHGLSKLEHPRILIRRPGGENLLQRIRGDQYAQQRKDNIHYPFRSRGDWQLAQWLTNSPLTQAQIDSFLKLEEVNQSRCHFSTPTLIYVYRLKLILHPSQARVTCATVSRISRLYPAGSTVSSQSLGMRLRTPWSCTGVTGWRSSNSFTPTPCSPDAWKRGPTSSETHSSRISVYMVIS